MKELISEYGWIVLVIAILALVVGVGGNTDGTLAGAASDVVTETITEVGGIG